MDRLSAMSMFVSVVDAGGFAKAARQLDLSPPAVTRGIADLEAHLGVRLLTRTTRVVRVTDAGAAYAQECKAILAAIQGAEARATGDTKQVRGGLRVTAPVAFGQRILAPIFAEYLQTWPEADLTCLYFDRIVNLVEEGVDVAVRIGELPDSSLIASKVGHVRRVLVASPAYLKKRGAPKDLDQLHEHALITTTTMGEQSTWHFGSGSHRHSVTFRPRLRSTSVVAAGQAAIDGVGIAQLPRYVVAHAVADGQLQVLLEGCEGSPQPVHVVYAEARQQTCKLRRFIELVATRLREHPALR